jgi:hypothetical protein
MIDDYGGKRAKLLSSGRHGSITIGARAHAGGLPPLWPFVFYF